MSGARRTATAEIMGTVISITAPGGDDPALFTRATRAAFALLRHADEVFSPFRAGSPVSRIAGGTLALSDLPGHPDGADIREVLALCALLKTRSGGAFDAWAVGDPPVFDPCGAVKGWAAERASVALAEHGLRAHALTAGGDVRLRGSAGGPWRIGITDPFRPGRVVAVAEVGEGAVATSGTVERGTHIWDPRHHRPAACIAQVTVIGPSLTWADGYATAAMALGGQARPWLTALARDRGYESLAVTAGGAVWWTPGMADHVPALGDLVVSAG